MDFEPSPKVRELRGRIAEFMDRYIHPAEAEIAAQADMIRPGVPYPPALVPLRKRAKAEGLWNLFLPDEEYGAGLKNWEYGILCELMGRSLAAPAAFNCSAPDTGNIEILAEFGTPEQKKRWLEPLLEGEIRSCFSMTEPEVAGSDPTLLRTRAVRDGFMIAQARLGPGRIHHCMRAIGGAERALEMMCRRANGRVAFGEPLAKKQFVQDMVATSRMEIDQARLLCLYAAWKMDTVGKKEARQEISMIKVVAANVFMNVLDRAIQVHGALGVSDDTPLARMWRDGRMLRLADGPDEVHKQTIARRELARFA